MAPNRRCHYSSAFKRKVVLAAELSSIVEAGRDFSMDERNVCRWRRQRGRIFACAATRMALPGPRKGRHHEMEMALADFLRMQRAAALPVTTKVLQAKAKELSRERGLSRNDISGTLIVHSFKKCSTSNALDGTEDSALSEDDNDKQASDEASSDDDSE